MARSQPRWGWHQLDQQAARHLVADASLPRAALVLDIGAGTGAITSHLVSAGHHVVAVELHDGRVRHLEQRATIRPADHGRTSRRVRPPAATTPVPRRRQPALWNHECRVAPSPSPREPIGDRPSRAAGLGCPPVDDARCSRRRSLGDEVHGSARTASSAAAVQPSTGKRLPDPHHRTPQVKRNRPMSRAVRDTGPSHRRPAPRRHVSRRYGRAVGGAPLSSSVRCQRPIRGPACMNCQWRPSQSCAV